MFAWEWPLGAIAGSALHRSIEARLIVLPMAGLAAALLYQATNPAIYYSVALVVYFWAYSEGEVCYGSLQTWEQSTNYNRWWLQSHGHYPNEVGLERYKRSSSSTPLAQLNLPDSGEESEARRWHSISGKKCILKLSLAMAPAILCTHREEEKRKRYL